VVDASFHRCPAHGVQRLIDVSEGTIAPLSGPWIVLFLRDIGAGPAQKIHDLAEAVFPGKLRIDAWMLVKILAIEYRGPVDFSDRGFHFGFGGAQ
jgi:hypothetical protein